jgi:hypothetical protein
MLEFFIIHSIFAIFGKRGFQQTVGIPKDANCAPLLADLFLYTYTGTCQGKTKRS